MFSSFSLAKASYMIILNYKVLENHNSPVFPERKKDWG